MKHISMLAALVFSMNANAALIESAYYSDNLGGTIQYNIDEETGLEWLDFGQVVGGNQTFGATIQEAVDYYSVDGWRLATSDEVYQLFDNVFPTFDGGANGYAADTLSSWNPELDEAWSEWLFSFGTYSDEGYLSSRGRYIDSNGDEQVIGIGMLTGTQYIFGPTFEYSWSTGTGGLDDIGVMMVQGSRGLEPPPEVPVPAAAWLFLSGLLGLIAVARRSSLKR